MIVTVTPSPSIDWTVHVDSFEFAAVNRASSKTREASGKGINVSVALHRNGVPTTAVFPAGKGSGQFIIDELAAQGVPVVSVDSGREVRTNITLMIPGQSGTKINEAGEALAPDVFRRVLEACEDTLRNALGSADGHPVMLAVCGSLPPGAPEGFHRALIGIGRRVGVPVIVDASGDVLHAAIPEGPDLIKPNVHELAEETGLSIATLGDVAAAADKLREKGAGAVLASLGADGMMLIDEEGAVHGTARNIAVVNTVGAGDAALAGFLAGLALGKDRIECLRSALTYASSAVGHRTTLFEVDPAIADRITVTDNYDRNLPLSEPATGGIDAAAAPDATSSQ